MHVMKCLSCHHRQLFLIELGELGKIFTGKWDSIKSITHLILSMVYICNTKKKTCIC